MCLSDYIRFIYFGRMYLKKTATFYWKFMKLDFLFNHRFFSRINLSENLLLSVIAIQFFFEERVYHYNVIDMRTIEWHFILDGTMKSWIKFSCSSKKFFENVYIYGSHLFIKISKDKNVPFWDSYNVMVL